MNLREEALLDAIRDYDAMIEAWEKVLAAQEVKAGRTRAWARQTLDIIQCLQRAFPDTVGKLSFWDVIGPLKAELKADDPIVHVLVHGRTPCWLAAPPEMWPQGESWSSIEDLPQVDPETICEWCIKGGPNR